MQEQNSNDRLSRFSNIAGYALISVTIYLFLFIVLGPSEVLPGGTIYELLILWLSSLTLGTLVKKIHLPPLLGMLLSGLLLKNVPFLSLTVPSPLGTSIRAVGLAVIFLRSGLELDVTAVRKAGGTAARLTLIPGVVEAITGAVTCRFLLDMPVFLSLSLGFILAAVSPAVVVVGMFDLQKRGYGVKKGIPSLIVAAASFDDVVAISGFSFFIDLAVKSHGTSGGSLASLVHGPLSIVFGIGLGCLGGAILSITKIWNTRTKRSAIALSLAMVFMFGMSKLHYSGSGAMGVIIMAMIASWCWNNGYPSVLALNNNTTTSTDDDSDDNKPQQEQYDKINHAAHDTERVCEIIWNVACQPLLFGVIGNALDFAMLSRAGTVPKSIAVISIGLVARLLAAFFATSGKIDNENKDGTPTTTTTSDRFTLRERVFIALAWMPKATVQAALCSIPLDLIEATLKNDPDYTKYLEWGHMILSTSILSIIITAPLGLLCIQILGPKFLTCDLTKEDEDCEDGNGGGELEENPVRNDFSKV